MMDRQNKPLSIAIFGPLLLIGIGVVFLLNNLGLLSKGIWDILNIFLPVILIASGVDGLIRRNGVIVPLLILVSGVLIVGTNLNLLYLDLWYLITRGWPILLIALGMDVLLGQRAAWSSVISAGVVLAMYAGLIWFFSSEPASTNTYRHESVTFNVGDNNHANVTIEPKVGRFLVSTSSQPDKLIEADIDLFLNQGKLIKKFDEKNGNAEVYLGLGKVSVHGPIQEAPEKSMIWDIRLNPSVVFDLTLNLGVGDIHFDLKDVNIEELTVNIGVGKSTIILPAHGIYDVSIDGGVGDLTILIPAGLEAKISIDSGISSNEIDDRFLHSGDGYETPGYPSAKNRVNLSIHQGIGKITIR